ncbi:FK506-binding protein 2 precursor [Coniochaeta sp. 2T2.1]|nr:FK506-binding protein 2 precursor [Coniochaeta sp. 2T2.1]
MRNPGIGAIGVDNADTTPSSLTSSSPTTPTVVSITMSTSTSTTSPFPTSAISTSDSDSSNGECSLLGPFALFVQLVLGGLALLALVYKRWRERPQRPLKIWFFDVSKQVFGSVLVHGANVFMSMLTSGRFDVKITPAVAVTADPTTAAARGMLELAVVVGRGLGVVTGRGHGEGGGEGGGYTPNPCSFYLLHIAVDTTLGIPILILLLRLYTSLVALTPLGKPRESIQSGNYGRPPNVWWWLKQSFIYFCGLFGMKICVLIIFLVFPWISHVGDWALGWTEGNEELQVVFVMMLFPLIMNAMQYYIIDSFIKMKETGEGGECEEGSEEDSESEGGGSVYEGVAGSDGDDSTGSDSDLEDRETKKKTKAPARTKVVVGRRDEAEDREYDPDVDGDSQTAVGSSASPRTPGGSESERGKLLSKAEFPHE